MGACCDRVSMTEIFHYLNINAYLEPRSGHPVYRDVMYYYWVVEGVGKHG